MATKSIFIKLGLKGDKKAAQGLKKVDNSVTNLGKSAAKLAVGYFSARGLINAFKFATEAAIEQERQEKRLATALGHTSQSLLNQASALQKMTIFGDEAIIGVQASIAMFTDNEEAIRKATEATLDMAAATGMDLKTAGDLVAKSLGSSTNALSRYGIVVEGAVGSSERLESLVTNIADKMGGQAAAAAETMGGQMQQLKNAVGDLAEDFGVLLFPALDGAVQKMKSMVDSINLVKAGVQGGETGINPEQLAVIEALAKAKAELRQTALDFQAVTDEFGLLPEGTGALDDFIEKSNRLQAVIQVLEDQLVSMTEKQKESNEAWDDAVDILPDMAVSMDSLPLMKIADGFDQAKESSKEFYATSIAGALDQIKSYLAQAVAGVIAREVGTKGLVGLATGTAGAIAVAALFDRYVPKFERGGDFVTQGPQMIMVGDNPGGRERVQVTPISSPNVNGPSGITINFNAPVTNADFVRDVVVPEIEKAKVLA